MSRAMPAAVLLALALSACAADEPACTVPEGADPDWIGVLRCDRDYELLHAERSDAIFARTRTINWLIDREDENRVYFIDTRTWDLHYAFASAYLEREGLTPVGDHAEFNLLNYRRADRRFVLGKLIRYLDQDLLTIELSAGDTAGADMIVDAYQRLAGALHDGDELVYRPVSSDQERLLPDIEPRIPVVRTEDVFLGQSYQALHQTAGVGTLRFVRLAELAAEPVSPTEIVVLDRVPSDISLVSGIVTAEFQTPLSHVNLLSKNRGTPNMALRDAWDDPALRALEGELVRLEVGAQDYAIAPASAAEAEAFWDSLRPGEPLVPALDLSVDRLLDATELGHGDADQVGAKAANLFEMARIGGDGGAPVPLPERPFAIPFAFFDRHMTASGLDRVADELLADHAAGALTGSELEERLFDLRWQIFRAPMNPDDLAAITAELAARWGSTTRVRFRSSTNAEDLASFSGAGLYTSASATLEDGDAAVARAVKAVWASVWNRQAFVERDFYRVEHGAVRMGVLVHPAFGDEVANGVAVTINEFADNRPAFYLNSQVGEVSVTNPTGEAIPEQLLYYTWYEEPEYEIITRSSLLADRPGWPGGRSVLTDDELAALVHELERIHLHFKRLYPPSADFAMDVEYKLAPGRRVVVKQARPLARR